ncbi:MAG: hypothetical protein ACOVQ6_04775, partial [Brevundimonas sp.]
TSLFSGIDLIMGHTPDCEHGASTIDAQMAQSGQSPLSSEAFAAEILMSRGVTTNDYSCGQSGQSASRRQ